MEQNNQQSLNNNDFIPSSLCPPGSLDYDLYGYSAKTPPHFQTYCKKYEEEQFVVSESFLYKMEDVLGHLSSYIGAERQAYENKTGMCYNVYLQHLTTFSADIAKTRMLIDSVRQNPMKESSPKVETNLKTYTVDF